MSAGLGAPAPGGSVRVAAPWGSAPELALVRGLVAVLGLVPVGAGLYGMLAGPWMAGSAAGVVPGGGLDSHFRYMSGLLLAIGIGFWSTLPDFARSGPRFRLLTGIVVVGGLGRLLGVVLHGWPPATMVFGLVMELGVTPGLCAWQARIARRSGAEAAG